MILWDRLTILLPGRLSQVTDYQLLAAIQALSSEDTVRVQEFTTVLGPHAIAHLGLLCRTRGTTWYVGVLACSVMDERPLTNPIV